MRSHDLARRAALLVGGVAVVTMATWTAGCTKKEEPTKPPESPTQTSGPAPSSAPPPSGAPISPTEKAPTLTPGGPNSFTPTVIAPGAPTALPGNVITGQ